MENKEKEVDENMIANFAKIHEFMKWFKFMQENRLVWLIHQNKVLSIETNKVVIQNYLSNDFGINEVDNVISELLKYKLIEEKICDEQVTYILDECKYEVYRGIITNYFSPHIKALDILDSEELLGSKFGGSNDRFTFIISTLDVSSSSDGNFVLQQLLNDSLSKEDEESHSLTIDTLKIVGLVKEVRGYLVLNRQLLKKLFNFVTEISKVISD